MKEIIDVLQSIIASTDLSQPHEPIIFGLDGRCGSGKSTLAETLENTLNAHVIHMDDFYMPLHLRNDQSFLISGGHLMLHRFEDEIVSPIKKRLPIQYNRFDCRTQTYAPKVVLEPKSVYIIEGAYCMLPVFRDLYRYKLFLTHSQEIQQKRLRQRVGADRLSDYNHYWIPLEEAYFERDKVPSICDYVLDTSDLW